MSDRDLMKQLADLPPEKRALLFEQLKKRKAAAATSPSPIGRQSRPADGVPLSFAQQRLWLLDQMQPGKPWYNISRMLRLAGPLDVATIERSLNQIVSRHEALRTIFVPVDEQPLQRIVPDLIVGLPVVDLSAVPAAEREDALRRLAGADVRRPFDLSRAPLLRASLLRLGDEEHALLLTMHHIISDGWSIEVLFRELSALYNAYSSRHPSPLPELPIQYADFALWQRQALQGELPEQQLSYWKQQLQGRPAILELPTDRPRPATQTFAGAIRSFVMPAALAEGLKTLSQREGVTLFITLVAAFTALLSRYTRQEDILVGTPIAGRTRAEVEGLIGFFVNTLVLRADLSGDPTFRELLGRLRGVAQGAYTHQDLPFEKLVEELAPERAMSHTPLFQVLFTLQSATMAPPELTHLRLGALETIDKGMAHFDLSLALEETRGGLVGLFQYSTDLFDPATIDRMADHFQTLLASAVADPDRRIADLPLLTEAERRQLLVEWNATQTAYPAETCIHQLFEAQVERTPDAVALVFDGRTTGDKETRRQGDKETRKPTGQMGLSPQSSVLSPECLTYAELNRRANQLAHHLRALGVGPEVRAGLCVERSLDLVIGLLGILKAGGAYVPLDPDVPPERLAFTLADAQATVLLTGKGLGIGDKERGRQGEGETGRQGTPSQAPNPKPDGPSPTPIVVHLDADWATIAQERATNPANTTTAENMAYVIYTSGSTGTPRGVIVYHRSVVNLALAIERTIYARRTDAQQRISLNGPLAFDTSVKQVVQLLYGHTLYLIPQAIRFDRDALASYLRTHALDVFDCTPAQLRLLLADGRLDGLEGVTRVLVGGEAIDDALWQALAQAEGREIYNLYGPTECTVDASACRVGTTPGGPTIGRPIANTRIYLLDQRLQPVPVGVPGELYIGGAGVARGYHDRPDLTAERFLPNPFADQPGARDLGLGTWEGELAAKPLAPSPKSHGHRLYRTGDLARYRPDGAIEYLGRIDHQVKIRGYRVEPGEIEAALGQHPAVREVVVLAREDVPGDKRLVAYVVPTTDKETRRQGDKESGDAGDAQSSAAPSSLILHPSSLGVELRAFLKERLPNYMVPSGFVILDALPLTSNGKIDRRALPAPDYAHTDAADTFVAPRTPVEEQLAGLWSDVLGLERIGIHDNFFALGGHSILAVQIIARMRAALQRDVPLRAFFEQPTVAEIARMIEERRDSAPTRRAAPIARATRDPRRVQISPQGGLTVPGGFKKKE